MENFIVSQGARDILLKSIAQVIPTYIMSYFAIPTSVCDGLEFLMSRYWCRGDEDKRKIH